MPDENLAVLPTCHSSWQEPVIPYTLFLACHDDISARPLMSFRFLTLSLRHYPPIPHYSNASNSCLYN